MRFLTFQLQHLQQQQQQQNLKTSVLKRQQPTSVGEKNPNISWPTQLSDRPITSSSANFDKNLHADSYEADHQS